ncbi:hypothetical protein BC834DRAFT_313112 [Gloeopeniophorella convolvens]|nr:hypothetical protein BC834DRAFT_313112 [Gloeopeniophorella convolvens]
MSSLAFDTMAVAMGGWKAEIRSQAEQTRIEEDNFKEAETDLEQILQREDAHPFLHHQFRIKKDIEDREGNPRADMNAIGKQEWGCRGAEVTTLRNHGEMEVVSGLKNAANDQRDPSREGERLWQGEGSRSSKLDLQASALWVDTSAGVYGAAAANEVSSTSSEHVPYHHHPLSG